MIEDLPKYLEALSETMTMIEAGKKNHEIISELDCSYSIPPSYGRQMVMYAHALRNRLREFDRSWGQPKEVRENLLQGGLGIKL